MSAGTAVILSVGTDEDENLVAPLNDQLRDEAGWDDWTLGCLGDAFGGPKVPPSLWGGTVKYFDFASFARIVCGLPWRDRDAVQVMLYDGADFRWRMLSLDDLLAAVAGRPS